MLDLQVLVSPCLSCSDLLAELHCHDGIEAAAPLQYSSRRSESRDPHLVFFYFLTQFSFTTANRHSRLQLAPVKQKVLAVSVEHSAGGASQLSALHPVEFGENVKLRRH